MRKALIPVLLAALLLASGCVTHVVRPVSQPGWHNYCPVCQHSPVEATLYDGVVSYGVFVFTTPPGGLVLHECPNCGNLWVSRPAR